VRRNHLAVKAFNHKSRKQRITTLEQLREVVDPIKQQYQSMMVNMDEFMSENPQFAKEPGAIMDIIDSFY
jgi:hypothetical protein